MKKILFAALSLAFVFAAPASASPGLTMTVWNNIPYLVYAPDSSTIDQEIAYTSVTTPDSVQIVSAPDPQGFGYGIPGFTAYRFTGTLNVVETGFYQFTTYADDAARLTLDGATLTEADFYNGNLNAPYVATVELQAGAHAFDLFAFQTVGGAYIYNYIDGPSGLTFSSDLPVPEPAMLGLFGMGAIGLGFARRRKAA